MIIAEKHWPFTTQLTGMESYVLLDGLTYLGHDVSELHLRGPLRRLALRGLRTSHMAGRPRKPHQPLTLQQVACDKNECDIKELGKADDGTQMFFRALCGKPSHYLYKLVSGVNKNPTKSLDCRVCNPNPAKRVSGYEKELYKVLDSMGYEYAVEALVLRSDDATDRRTSWVKVDAWLPWTTPRLMIMVDGQGHTCSGYSYNGKRKAVELSDQASIDASYEGVVLQAGMRMVRLHHADCSTEKIKLMIEKGLAASDPCILYSPSYDTPPRTRV